MKRILPLSLLMLLAYSIVPRKDISAGITNQNLYISMAGEEITVPLFTLAAIVGISFYIYYVLSSSKEDALVTLDNDITSSPAISDRGVASNLSFENAIESQKAQRIVILKKAIKYAFYVGILSALFKNYTLFDIPFLTLMILLFLDIIIGSAVAFPVLWLLIHFKESDTAKQVKKNVSKTVCSRVCPIDAKTTPDIMWKYHDMLKDDIITQKEFDRFREKMMKEAEE